MTCTQYLHRTNGVRQVLRSMTVKSCILNILTHTKKLEINKHIWALWFNIIVFYNQIMFSITAQWYTRSFLFVDCQSWNVLCLDKMVDIILWKFPSRWLKLLYKIDCLNYMQKFCSWSNLRLTIHIPPKFEFIVNDNYIATPAINLYLTS